MHPRSLTIVAEPEEVVLWSTCHLVLVLFAGAGYWLSFFSSEIICCVAIISEPSRWQHWLDWQQWGCCLLVERYGSVETSCDGIHAPLCLLELCSEGFAQQVIAEYALPRLRPYSLMVC